MIFQPVFKLYLYKFYSYIFCSTGISHLLVYLRDVWWEVPVLQPCLFAGPLEGGGWAAPVAMSAPLQSLCEIDWKMYTYLWKNTPVTSHGYSVWRFVQLLKSRKVLMSRNRDWCLEFCSVADVSYSGWRPVTVAGVNYLKIRVTRRQPL